MILRIPISKKTAGIILNLPLFIIGSIFLLAIYGWLWIIGIEIKFSDDSSDGGD